MPYIEMNLPQVYMFPILNPPPTSLPIPSLWVVPVHQPQASSIVHRTWTGDSFHIWYYTYFNAILPNHPTLSLSHSSRCYTKRMCLILIDATNCPVKLWVLRYMPYRIFSLLCRIHLKTFNQGTSPTSLPTLLHPSHTKKQENREPTL